MGIEIRGNAAPSAKKPKLSRLAMILIAAIVLIIAVIVISSARKSSVYKPLNAAVDSCLNVCKSAAVTLNLENDHEYLDKLNDAEHENDADDKAEDTAELVGYMLSRTDSQTVRDELTGALNRVNIALRDAHK